MSSLYSRPYSPYSQDKPQQSQLALRSKAFSHLDNIPHSSTQYPDHNLQVNQDKINGIKKKYQKVIAAKSKNNQQNVRNTYDYTKSVSVLDSRDQFNAHSPYRKSCQTPNALYEKRQDQKNTLKHFPSRSYGARQANIPQKQYSQNGRNQIKSQLQSNRLTLNAMKYQLQSKLNDLTSKTKPTSTTPPPPLSSSTKNTSYEISSSFKHQDSQAYEAILNKYSKNNQPNDQRYSKYKVDYTNSSKKDSFESKNQQKSIEPPSYLPKYTANKPQTFNEQPKQLSTITQHSNSNNSDCHKQSSYEFQNRKTKEQSNNRTQVGLRSTIEPRSYLNDKYEGSRYANASFIDNKQGNKTNMEFTLKKVENKPSYSPIRKPQTPLTPNKYNYQRKIEPSANYSNINSKTYQYQNNTNYDQISFAQPQKTPILDRSQIQQLKDKYSVSGSSNYQQNLNKDKSVGKGETKDNQKITREIQKLDLKIKQIEQNKKDLNINFKPYDPSSKNVNKPITPSEYKYQRSTQFKYQASSQLKHQVSTQLKNNVSYNEKDRILPISNSSYSNFNKNKQSFKPQPYRPNFNQTTKFQPSKTHTTSFGIKMVSSNNNEDQLSQRSVSDSNFKNKINNYIYKQQAKVDHYRKKQNQDQVPSHNSIKALVKVLGQQAALDEVLRNNKIWFVSQNKTKKWDQLKKELENIGLNLNQSKLKETFTLDDSENNPFFSVTQSKCTIKSLAQSYKQSQKFWQQKILYKFNRCQLQSQGFDNNKIDCDKKGYIQVQDLVRFLNIQSGTFFRNRDVSVIFKRMNSKGNTIHFIELLNLVSK